MLSDTWSDPDLPVLAAAIEIYDERSGASGLTDDLVATRAALPSDVVRRSLIRLNGTYLDLKVDNNVMTATVDRVWVLGVSADARRAVGQWPSPELATERLLASLSEIATNGSSEEVRSRARRALEAFGGVGKQVVIQALTKVLLGELPL